jgi:hypothetical protein
MEITIPSETAYLSSEDASHTLHLTKQNGDYTPPIPGDHDILGIRFEWPDELDEFAVIIGGQQVAAFSKDTHQQLETFPIYLSKLMFHVASIEFRYNKDFLMQREEHEMVDESVEEKQLGELTEIYDGNDFHVGRAVTRVRVSTGNKVRKITKRVDVCVPRITLLVSAPALDKKRNYLYMEVPVRQKVCIDRNDLQYYLDKHELQVLSGDEHTVVGYATNYIMYNSGLAALKYGHISV